MKNPLFPAASAYLAQFDRELVVHLNAADLACVSDWDLCEAKLNASDALRSRGLLGERTFVSFQMCDHNGFTLYGQEITPEVDSAAWDAVERAFLAAKRASSRA